MISIRNNYESRPWSSLVCWFVSDGFSCWKPTWLAASQSPSIAELRKQPSVESTKAPLHFDNSPLSSSSTNKQRPQLSVALQITNKGFSGYDILYVCGDNDVTATHSHVSMLIITASSYFIRLIQVLSRWMNYTSQVNRYLFCFFQITSNSSSIHQISLSRNVQRGSNPFRFEFLVLNSLGIQIRFQIESSTYDKLETAVKKIHFQWISYLHQ